MDTQPGACAVSTTLVEISVSCRNLLNMDVLGKSDPMCVMKVKQFASHEWREAGRTETINNNLNPDFVHKFAIDYFFQESQKLTFEIYDIDRIKKNDFIGSAECTLAELVHAGKLERQLEGTHGRAGTIMLSAQEASLCKEEITLQFKAQNLDKKDVFGKSDGFLVFSREGTDEHQGYTIVHKTEVIKNNLNPTWRPFTVSVGRLSQGDPDRVLKVDCYDWNQNGNNVLIGSFETSVLQLRRGPGDVNDYPLINDTKKTKKKNYTNSGMVKLMSCKVQTINTFMDYIKGGTQVHCIIAVDFTSSNGDPRSPDSLHYFDPSKPNLYARALRAVCEIIADYKSDKLFPALGFGGKLSPQGPVSHEFFLNGHATNPYCEGVEGVLNAYYQTLQRVQLSGPTHFAPVVKHVARLASNSGAPGGNYFILLMLTDGDNGDIAETRAAIVNASGLPISIVIVGIGGADFKEMKVLDGDSVRLTDAKGRKAERDIVQFVSFREFIGGSFGDDLNHSQVLLAKEVLAEIPDQVMSYMKKYGVKPNPVRPNPNPVQANPPVGAKPKPTVPKPMAR